METFERTDWYVVFTAFRAEKGVKARLEEAGVECCLPLRGMPCEWGGEVVEVQLPLLSGCLFVRVASSRLAEVLEQRGVVACARKEGRPVALSEEEVRAVCERMEREGVWGL